MSFSGSKDKQTEKVIVSPSGKVPAFQDPVLDFKVINYDLEKSEHDYDHNILLRHVSLEMLNPVHGCESRKSTMMVAIVNLVATVCGGGVLSLPLVFKRAGIIPTTIFMIYGCLSTDFSLYVLVSCARRTGGRSYGDVAKAAFGNAAEVATTSLLSLLLIGTLTAYLVLVKDIWTPVLLSLLPDAVRDPLLLPFDEKNVTIPNEETEVTADQTELVASKQGGNLILLCIVVFGSPLLLKNDLHALRHTCYIGFCSCTLLMIAVVFRAYQAAEQPPGRQLMELNWYSTDISDLAFGFPVVVLCFLCSFNVLGVHSSLSNPTRARVKFVLDKSMLVCFVLFYLVGIGGYLYAMDETCDNILLNFSLSDPAILVGRLGFCFTLLFGLPLVTLPCREAFRAIPDQIHSWRVDAALAKEFQEVDQERREKGAHLVINGVDFDEYDPLVVTEDPVKQHATMLTYGAMHSEEHLIGTSHDEDVVTSSTSYTSSHDCHGAVEFDNHLTNQHGMNHDGEGKWEAFIHFGSTFAIVGTCYFFAVSVSGVGFVWSLAGSSMAIVIAFVIPTACYLKIREHKKLNPRSATATAILIVSVIAAPICTMQAINNAR